MTITAVGLFSGIGAFEYAAQQVGIEVRAAYDVDPSAVHWHRQALRHMNRSIYPVYEADVLKLEQIPSCDIGLAGLPCQPFSPERTGRGRGMADARGSPLWEAAARLFSGAGAQVVVIENVDEAVREAVLAGARIFAAWGFPHHHYHLVRAADYGSAQVRRRLWMTFSREPLLWEPDGPAPGPRPLQDFLFCPEDFAGDVDDGLDYDRFRQALAPCYLGSRHMQGLIQKRVREAGKTGFGLKAVPVNHQGTVGAITRNYWKGGGSAPFVADRCLECGYPVGPLDGFLYLADLDLGEDRLWFPPHVLCADCLERLASEGSCQVGQDGEYVQLPPLDLSHPYMPELRDYLHRRLAAGATSVRRFHPREIARLFGLPDTWPLPEAPGAASQLLGNSLHVPTAMAVLRGVIRALENRQPVPVQARLAI